ncbi:nucleolar protein 9 [Anopheles nili]|uniref:nucleolar protein 9 n=1 Tax=Anopheles nili TaxID=185578 RepID=UPI00237A6121|nr:nucleolar protein 9 [Anopheles nili]
MAEDKYAVQDPPVTSETRGSNYYKNRSKKLKRKNRFLQNAKSFGRKNSFGRGAELDQMQYQYLVTILEAMTKQEDADERQLMANNVLEQLTGKEIRTASNQLGSRVLENLLAYTDETMFAKQMETFADNFRVVCCDKFASHVLQRILVVAMFRSAAPLQPKEDERKVDEESSEAQQNKKQKPSSKPPSGHGERNDQTIWPWEEYSMKESYTDEHRQACGAFVERLTMFLINNLEEFVWDSTANYVVRQCVLNLSGITKLKSTEDVESHRLTVPEKWQKLLQKLTFQLEVWPQFADMPGYELTSAVLQDLLRALAASNDGFQLEQLALKIHNESFVGRKDQSVKKEEDGDEKYNEEAMDTTEEPSSNLPQVFRQASTIRLLEACIAVVPAAFLKDKIFAKLFRTHLRELALSRTCNFAVQKLIDHTHDKDLMDLIFGELEDSIEQILRVGHTGIVLAVAKACARLSCQQGKFVKQLLEALHCSEATPAKMISAVLHLIPADVQSSEAKAAVHLHGSLILQAVLDFNKPIKFVTALLEMPNDRLVEILTDPRGSFVANAFVASRFVGEKSREKLVRHLDGQYNRLVLSVHGSHVVELLYGTGNPAQREAIVRELAEQCPQLNSKPWGVIINKRLLVDTYKRDPARWKVAIKNNDKVGRMFDKLVPGVKRKAIS